MEFVYSAYPVISALGYGAYIKNKDDDQGCKQELERFVGVSVAFYVSTTFII